jgi:hypothetical protein
VGAGGILDSDISPKPALPVPSSILHLTTVWPLASNLLKGGANNMVQIPGLGGFLYMA